MSYFRQWLSEATNPRHILLVDDSEEDCRIIEMHSREFNVEWTIARSYSEAIQALTDGSKKFRLIVLDLNLGQRNVGVQLFSAIKDTWPWIPVLVLSGHIDDEVIDQLTGTGFVMFLKKPHHFDSRFFGELFFALNIPRKAQAQSKETTKSETI